MFNIQQAADKAGISTGLLHLWVSTGKVKPSLNMMVNPDAVQDSVARKAAKQWARRDETSNWIFSDDDVARIRSIAKRTALKRNQVESQHVAGTAYTPQELAALWGLSVDKIIQIFEHEKDVMVMGHAGNSRRRPYRTLRIPEKVADRVQRRISNT